MNTWDILLRSNYYVRYKPLDIALITLRGSSLTANV